MNLSRKFLAGAILALLPLTGALACNTTAWNGGATGTTIADDPDLLPTNAEAGTPVAVKRYSGKCGLQASADSFVTDNSPTADGSAGTPYRARFYVYTSPTAATKVFSATASDGGADAEVLSVTYNPGTSFVATAPGATATANGIVANKWYMVEIKYQNNTPLEMWVRGNASATEIEAESAGNAGPGGVGSARLGAVGPTTGTVTVDEFDSSRGNTRIGGLLRGDAAGNAGGAPDNKCDANDAIAMISEFFVIASNQPQFTLAPGQPDCNEDGAMDAGDLSCLVQRFFAEANNSQPCGGA